MREPVSGHEVVKKKRGCNNLEKETAGLEKVKVIARIHTDFPTKFGIPRQSGLSDAAGLVVFEPEFRQPDALRGIEEYTHLWLLWGFSEVRQESGTWKATVRPPRLGGNERVGVFACRSPYRPNPIGLSCVKLERIISHEKYGMCLLVSGVDMMDQTGRPFTISSRICLMWMRTRRRAEDLRIKNRPIIWKYRYLMRV